MQKYWFNLFQPQNCMYLLWTRQMQRLHQLISQTSHWVEFQAGYHFVNFKSECDVFDFRQLMSLCLFTGTSCGCRHYNFSSPICPIPMNTLCVEEFCFSVFFLLFFIFFFQIWLKGAPDVQGSGLLLILFKTLIPLDDLRWSPGIFCQRCQRSNLLWHNILDKHFPGH